MSGYLITGVMPDGTVEEIWRMPDPDWISNPTAVASLASTHTSYGEKREMLSVKVGDRLGFNDGICHVLGIETAKLPKTEGYNVLLRVNRDNRIVRIKVPKTVRLTELWQIPSKVYEIDERYGLEVEYYDPPVRTVDPPGQTKPWSCVYGYGSRPL